MSKCRARVKKFRNPFWFSAFVKPTIEEETEGLTEVAGEGGPELPPKIIQKGPKEPKYPEPKYPDYNPNLRTKRPKNQGLPGKPKYPNRKHAHFEFDVDFDSETPVQSDIAQNSQTGMYKFFEYYYT